MLRIIEGAVLNTYDAHNEPRNEIRARGIAKRAVGTLSAEMPKVLAEILTLSAKDGVRPSDCPTCGFPQVAKGNQNHRPQRSRAVRVGGAQFGKRHPLYSLYKSLVIEMRGIRLTGTQEQVKARVELLRMIAGMFPEHS